MDSIHSLVQTVQPGQVYRHLLYEPGRGNRWLKRAFELYCRLFLFKVYCPVHTTGRAHLPDTSFLLCSNHCSHMDSVALMVATGWPFQRFGMMAAMDYFFENKTRKMFLNAFMNLIPIKRRPSQRELVEAIVACRQFTDAKKRCVIIFPEGTRNLSGQLLPFKKGPAMISIEVGMPIVPAYIRGTSRAMPKGRGLIRPAAISVHFGPALYPDDYLGGSTNGRFNKNYRYMTHELENQVRRFVEADCGEN